MASRSATVTLLVIALAAPAAAMRIKRQVKAHSNVEAQLGVGSYSELIQAFHSNLSTTEWGYTAKDAETMIEVQRLVNNNDEPRTDPLVWKWTPSGSHWTFPLTEKTEEDTPQAALALHMLHRHGLAPLAGSKHQEAFAKFFQKHGGKSVHTLCRPWRSSQLYLSCSRR